MKGKWKSEITVIPHENRWANCILEYTNKGEEIVMEVDFMRDEYIETLIQRHNEVMSKTYSDGCNEGVRICKAVYDGRNDKDKEV